MARRRINDPVGVPDNPNLVADPERASAIADEFSRKCAYLERQYRLEKRFGLDSRAFNASLAHLQKQIRHPASSVAVEHRLHPWIELVINQKARQLAGLQPGDSLGREHVEHVGDASLHVAKQTKAIRGKPGHAGLRRYIEGLIAAMQEATGKPVMAMRDRDSVYDPQIPGSNGKLIRLLVDRLEPGVSDSKLSYWVRQTRKNFAGKPMRFADLCPATARRSMAAWCRRRDIRASTSRCFSRFSVLSVGPIAR